MKRFKNIAKVVFGIAIVSVLVLYCSSPTEPWVKDPRDYTWTVDTIVNPSPHFEQTLLNSIWGSSPQDVYACGHTSGGPEIYHYDGENWSAIDLRDYGLRNGKRNKVFGYSENDVWIAGALGHSAEGGYKTSELVHFDGDEWESFEFETRSELLDVWGTNSNNLWACGKDGIVIHYDGSNWQIDTIKITVEEGRDYHLKSIVEWQGVPYVSGYKNTPVVFYFFNKQEDDWVNTDSSFYYEGIYKWGSAQLLVSNDNQMLSVGYDGLFEYVNSQWHNIFHIETGFLGAYECVSNKFLLAESRGKIYLSENENYEIIYQYSGDILLVELWGEERECFVVGWNKNNTFILHGR